MLVHQRVYVIISQKSSRYNVETNLWQEIRASGRAPPARSGAQVPGMAGLLIPKRILSGNDGTKNMDRYGMYAI